MSFFQHGVPRRGDIDQWSGAVCLLCVAAATTTKKTIVKASSASAADVAKNIKNDGKQDTDKVLIAKSSEKEQSKESVMKIEDNSDGDNNSDNNGNNNNINNVNKNGDKLLSFEKR